MAGISIQTKNASYYSAINTNKKAAKGIVGTFQGKYAKNTRSGFSASNYSVSAAKKEQSENRKKLLSALDTTETKTSVKNLSDKEAADLKASQIAAQKNETSEEAAKRLEETKKARKQVVFQGTSVNKKNGYLDLTKTNTEKKDTKAKKKLHYSYKDVASKIQRAKTSLSAGQALISAKRKVMELRRKAASGNVDSEEVMMALSHAKRMESIAKKKKHNLELEEMVEQVKARDDRMEKMEDSSSQIQNDVIETAKTTVESAEDDIKKQQEEYGEELKAEFEEMIKEEELDEEMTEELSEEVSKMIEEFGQEEMELLEETMEMLEQLEAVNPHMSDEQLEDLKRKHRASEDKALTKANMEYLKGMMKQLEKESQKNTVAAGAPQICTYSPASIVNPTITIQVPEGISVDVGC